MRQVTITLSNSYGRIIYELSGRVGVNPENMLEGILDVESEVDLPEKSEFAVRHKTFKDTPTVKGAINLVLSMAESRELRGIPHDLNGAHYKIELRVK